MKLDILLVISTIRGKLCPALEILWFGLSSYAAARRSGDGWVHWQFNDKYLIYYLHDNFKAITASLRCISAFWKDKFQLYPQSSKLDTKVTRKASCSNKMWSFLGYDDRFFNYSFYKKKKISMLAWRVLCCTHQSDRRIRVCISHQSDCCIRVCISHQSDCRIRVCISH